MAEIKSIEVTPEMVEAGLEVYLRFDETADDPSRFLSDVFRSMLEAYLLSSRKVLG